MNYIFTRNTIALAVMVTSIAIAPFSFAAPANHSSHNSQNQQQNPVVRKGLGGTVTDITGTTITITSGKKDAQTYTIDASKARFEGPQAKTITDIKIGDKILALGTVTGTNIQATIIFDRPASLGTPKAFEPSHAPKHKSH